MYSNKILHVILFFYLINQCSFILFLVKGSNICKRLMKILNEEIQFKRLVDYRHIDGINVWSSH